jgi:DNA-binding LacI/PurR family transcriptional regulator
MRQKNHRPLTLKDLARECGLSTAAVSRCLDPNPNSTIRVSRATAEKVAKMAKKLGYRHNMAARSLRKGRPKTIGMVCFQGLLRASPQRLLDAVDAVKSQDYQPIVHHMIDESPPAYRQVVETLLDERVDGVLLLQPTDHYPQAEVDRMLEAQLPVISLASSGLKRIPSYAVDKAQGFYLLARHLLEEGYRSILLVTTGKLPEGEITGKQTLSALQGCQRAIEEAGEISSGRFRIFETRSRGSLPDVPDEEHFTAVSLGGYAAARRLAVAGQLPEALLFLNSAAAAGALRALTEAGVRVPWDVAVAGFNSEAFTALGPLPITSVENPFREPCFTAVEHLIRIIQGETTIRQQFFPSPCHLVMRQSSVRRSLPPLLPEARILDWLPDGHLPPLEFSQMQFQRLHIQSPGS